jgi:hypothetical protein
VSDATFSDSPAHREHYSRLFSAAVHTSFPIKDYKYLLDAVRRDLQAREARIQEEFAAANAVIAKRAAGE